MLDFTLKTYKQLLTTLEDQNYTFKTFEQFIRAGSFDEKMIIMRHDVDRLPENALVMARIEKELGIKSTYFFRTIKSVFKPGIIREIAAMGHEVGYHYENLVAVSHQHSAFSKKKIEEIKHDIGAGVSQPGFQEQNQNDRNEKKAEGRKLEAESLYELAIEDFKRNLERLRKICPIKTICMHGSPLSKYDSRDLWEKYDYRDFGIIAEPYFDVDFEEVLYLTDTGRRWDGEKYSVRDKVTSKKVKVKSKKELGDRSKEVGDSRQETVDSSWESTRNINQKMKNLSTSQSHIFSSSEDPSFSTNEQINNLTYSFHSTIDIINAIKEGLMPGKIMMNVHPQRWTNNPVLWVKELIWQNVKNVIKRSLLKRLEGKSKKGKC
jgi:predicted DNA-binding transcriptional regulator